MNFQNNNFLIEKSNIIWLLFWDMYFKHTIIRSHLRYTFLTWILSCLSCSSCLIWTLYSDMHYYCLNFNYILFIVIKCCIKEIWVLSTWLIFMLPVLSRATCRDHFVRLCSSVSHSVFPRHCFSFISARVISLFGAQLSGFIHLSRVKITVLDIVFWGFHIVFFCVFIENTHNWMFPVILIIFLDFNSVLRIYKLIPKLRKLTWQNWIKSMGCNPIWRTN